MCRQLAYVGPPVTLESLILTPEHSLLHQSYKPKYQRNGTVNADGFGCGWYDTRVRPEPAIYKRAVPIWSDQNFFSMAGMIRSGAFVAAVRDATTGTSVEESSTAPFAREGWLFAHNGLFKNFDGAAGVKLRRAVSDQRLAAIRGTSDSEFLFARVLDRVDEGMTMTDALKAVTSECLEMTTGTFNFLIHDGSTFTATACGDSLYVLEGSKSLSGGVVVASEPYDADTAWREVPDGSVVTASKGVATVAPLGAGV